MNKITNIESVINQGYDIDFGIVFNKAFENYKKIALVSGLVFIVFTIILAALGMGIFAVFYTTINMTDFLADLKIQNFSGTAIIIYIFSIVIITALLSPVYAGILKIADCANQNQNFSISTAFEYYSNSYFKEIFTASVIVTFLSISISTLAQLINLNIVGILISYTISFFTFLTIPLIIFGDLSAIAAIKASFNIVKKQIIVLLGLLIVGILATCLGIFGFCIGIFFTIPFIFSLYYIIYNEIIGTNILSEIDEIGTPES